MKLSNYTFSKTKLNFAENFFNKNGFAIIKSFFNKTVIQKIKREIKKKIKEKNNFFYYEKINGKLKLRRIEKISDYSNKSREIIFSKRISKLIYKFEKKKFALFKDKLNFKYPGGQGYVPHIDGHFFWKDKNNNYQDGWKKYSDRFISIILPLDNSNIQNGCMYLANKNDTKKNLGSNFKQITKKLIINTPNLKKKDEKKFKFFPIQMKMGDICLFDWKCAHMSKKNISKSKNNFRMLFILTYCVKRKSSTNVRNQYYFGKLTSKNDLKNKSLLFQ